MGGISGWQRDPRIRYTSVRDSPAGTRSAHRCRRMQQLYSQVLNWRASRRQEQRLSCFRRWRSCWLWEKKAQAGPGRDVAEKYGRSPSERNVKRSSHSWVPSQSGAACGFCTQAATRIVESRRESQRSSNVWRCLQGMRVGWPGTPRRSLSFVFRLSLAPDGVSLHL